MTAKKVLVIDDSIMIRKMVANILADQFEVLEAKDGATGIDTAKKQRPDLILLDFVMPKMDGYDTLQALRREEPLKATPVIMMSGLKEQVTSRIPEPFTDFEFIEKPFESDALVARIQNALQVSPVVQVDLTSEPTIQLVLHKLTAIEALFIQGTENLIQREVVARLAAVNARVHRQEGSIKTLEQKIDHLTAEIQHQNRGLALIAHELKQIRKRLG
jgi:PleD family two-component response regulator